MKDIKIAEPMARAAWLPGLLWIACSAPSAQASGKAAATEAQTNRATGITPGKPTTATPMKSSNSAKLPIVTSTSQPALTTKADFVHDGKVVAAIGNYKVEDLGRYRITSVLTDGAKLTINMASKLLLADGTTMFLGARTDEERRLFLGKEVIVIGRLVVAPPRQPDQMARMDVVPTIAEITEVRAAK
jgi:hypothetical protein